ncbi:unnamed protein product [Chrysoparadoxa australica]
MEDTYQEQYEGRAAEEDSSSTTSTFNYLSDDSITGASGGNSPSCNTTTSASTTVDANHPAHLVDEECLGECDEADDRLYTGSFEGPEKTLEVCFKPGVGHPDGCRALDKAMLDQICKRAKCTILSCISNQHLDAYVLSESSLFVYRHKMLIKTCGTTTLLRCIPIMLHHACAGLGMELEWVGYSRKNFTFPGDQLFPHGSFQQELEYLKSHSHLSARLNGSGYILGPITGDHWFVYVADKCNRNNFVATDRTINIMMFDMDPAVAGMFFKKEGDDVEAMTKRTGIGNLVPGAQVDACAFDPCGYSMNAIQFDSYYTIHVTPEAKCSYASFETNNPYKSYRSTINNVLHVFRPRRFVLTMIADEAGLKTMSENPFDMKTLSLRNLGVYTNSSNCSTKACSTFILNLPLMLSSLSSYQATAWKASLSQTRSFTQVEGDCCCLMGNWELDASRSSRVKRRVRTMSHC